MMTILRSARASWVLTRSRKSYLRRCGWFESMARARPVQPNGDPIPWMTYPAIEFLSSRVQTGMRVFEFGTGYSTLWWASRVSSVTTCDHHPEWHAKIRAIAPQNVQLMLVELTADGAYCRAARSTGNQYDLLIIDGRDRVNCARQSLEAVSPTGVIIWDNSNRTRYIEGYAWLKAHGWRDLVFHGMGPSSAQAWSTSVFYRDGNCLGI